MSWLDAYDEPIGDLDMRKDKVDNLSPHITSQVLPSFEVYTPPVTYPKEVEETIGILMEVKPLDYTKLEDLGLNACSHDLFLSSKEIASVDEPEPQLLFNFLALYVNLGDKRGTDPPINPYSPGSFRMKVVKSLTIHTPPSPLVAYFHRNVRRDSVRIYSDAINIQGRRRQGLLRRCHKINMTIQLAREVTDNSFIQTQILTIQLPRGRVEKIYKMVKVMVTSSLVNPDKSVAERIRHQKQYDRRVNKRQMQTQESKIDAGKAVDVDLVIKKSSGTESEVQDDSSKPRNDTYVDDAYIRPIYDEEPMAEVQLTAEFNIFAIGQWHTKQPEIINKGQHGQILNEASNKAKMKKKINAYETINIELEDRVATLLKENETLKKHYKDLYDSIKIMRSKTIEQTTSLLANNADLKAQIQEKAFAIAALKNKLRKLKGNNVDTKFAKTSVLGMKDVRAGGRRTLKLERKSSNKADGSPLVKISAY
nr:ribonuclease H-like domain-containing protein [Tanacetum cinerariifolium]